MSTVTFACGSCGYDLSAILMPPPISVQCPLCLKTTEVHFFPALLAEPAKGASGETLIIDSESSCFYHPNKKAALICDHCGRFLCGLCDIEFNGRHVCSTCIESGIQKEDVAAPPQKSFYYDDVAIRVAVYPVLLWPFTIITAPIAIYIALRYWRKQKQKTFLPRNRWRFVVAVLVSVLELCFWASSAIPFLMVLTS